MSLSTLQAQLAALNSSRSNSAGLSIAANRTHEDRIGRGVAHSVQQGHSVLNRTIKHRPTLLYETTTAAADIPLATLQQNALVALQQFISQERLYPQSLSQAHVVLFAASDPPDATVLASSIRHLLTVLSCILMECDSNEHVYYTPSLHILEYLLRKYDIHVHYSVELLWSLLPLARSFPQLVHRCLLLCDWTAVHQSYLWLRPYCVETSASSDPPMPAPQLLAISLMKHVDILRTLCQSLLPTLWNIAQAEFEDDATFSARPDTVRIGLSRLLSYTAALIVDVLAYLQKQPPLEDATEEAVLRTLLPAVHRSWKRRGGGSDVPIEEFAAWGYVVAATLVECIPVSTEVVDLLCIGIIHSVVPIDNLAETDDDRRPVESSLNAMSCLLSILFSRENTMVEDDESSSPPNGIPLLHHPSETWLGCSGLSERMYDVIVQHFAAYDGSSLPNLLGWLLLDDPDSSADDSKMMVPIASFIAALFGRFTADTTVKRVDAATPLMTALMAHPHLRSIWMDPRFDFVASSVVFLLEGDRTLESHCRKMLLELHTLDAIAAERGIAILLQRTASRRSTSENVRVFWKDVLQLEGHENILQTMSDDDGSYIPPRIALEHADPSVRLRAIQDLVALSAGSETRQSRDSVFLLERLLRQLMHDSSAQVQIAICDALVKWLEHENSVVAISMKNSSLIMNLGLEVFYHFYDSIQSLEASFTHYMLVLGFLARNVARFGDNDLIWKWQSAIEGLVAMLSMNMNSNITEKAAGALLVAFDHPLPSSTDAVLSTANSLLRDCVPFIQRLNRLTQLKPVEAMVLASDASEVSMHKKCVLHMLQVLCDLLSKTNNKEDLDQLKEFASDTMTLSLYFIQSASSSDAVSSSELAALATTLLKCWDLIQCDWVERIPAVLIQIGSTDSDLMWSSISGSVLQSLVIGVRNSHGEEISPFMVILEAVVRLHQSNGSALAIKRLVRLAQDLVIDDSAVNYAPWLAVIPALSLLESKDRTIRIVVADFIRNLEPCIEKIVRLRGKDKSTKSLTSILEVCRCIPHSKSSSKLDEHNFLASFMASCIRESSEQAVLRDALLTLCLYSAMSCCCDFSEESSRMHLFRWLALQNNIGGFIAAAAVLDAVELAGEDAFPLVFRWKSLGSKLFDKLMTHGAESNPTTNTQSLCCEPVVKSICRMLKGVTISDPVLIISTGPRSKGQGGGGRTRSYSVGKMDGISVLTPYPDDMSRALIRVLLESGRNSAAKLFSSFVMREILGSATWGESVFKSLSKRFRVDIASAVIDFVRNYDVEGIHGFPIGVPLCAGDIVEVLKCGSADNLHFVAVVVDFVRNHVEELSNDKCIPDLLSGLFGVLRSGIKNQGNENVEDLEFVIHDTLVTLAKLFEQCCVGSSSLTVKLNAAALKDLNDVLLGIVGRDTELTRNHMLSFRLRSALLSLFVTLSDQFPDLFVESLIQCSIVSVSNCSKDMSREKIVSTIFAKVIPCFVRCASRCRLSLADFFYQFIAAVRNFDDEYKFTVFVALTKVLVTGPSTGSIESKTALRGGVGALMAYFLADEVFRNSMSIRGHHFNQSSVDFAVGLLDHCSPIEQMTSLLLLLQFVTELAQFQDGDLHGTSNIFNELLPTSMHIGQLAATGVCNNKVMKKSISYESSRCVVMALLRAFCDGLTLDSVRGYIQLGSEDASNLSLRLWQSVLLLQALSHLPVNHDSQNSDAVQFREIVSNASCESLEIIHGMLPLHVFLASATALIKDGDTVEIRCQALRLLSSRVQHVVPGSSEAFLFVDVLPIVLKFTCGSKVQKNLGRDDVTLIQSGIYTIENISRLLGLPLVMGVDQKKSSIRGMNYFSDSLQLCLRILVECQVLQSEDSVLPDYLLDLVSTSALCCAILVRIMGARSLSILPTLMNVLTSLLYSSNLLVLSCNCADDPPSIFHHKTVQLSIVRCLLAVTETVPQFLPPYLSKILSGSGILSSSLRVKVERKSDVFPIEEAVDRFCSVLSTKVAIRLLVPAVLQALQSSTKSDEILILMNILQTSSNDASSSAVFSQIDALLSAITTALEYEGTGEDQSRLVVTAGNVLVAMVLKLSEVQLRRLYKSLRDWRGNIIVADPHLNVIRRTGFWTMSARLSQELHSIFLPCLDLVSDDLVDELSLAVDMLQCGGASKELSAPETKKRKLGKSLGYSAESMKIVSPLLSCLESALRADAYQGGKWIRGDDNRKFERFLDPLGKLLYSRIPDNFPSPDNVLDKYQYLVQGNLENTGGSVIGCLLSLAMAGGNEQLWKPLNHVVVSACGDDFRSEVRRAGLVCLLELMKSLGEEYMVLLPENLPVISELLEDSNDEVARIAREVVTQAEELLGESLESSLR